MGNEEKRELYDKYGEEGVKNGGPSFGGDPMDLFSSFFGMGGMGGRQKPRGPQKGQDVVHGLKVSLDELYNGATRKIRVTRTRICKTCNGLGASKKEAVVDCNSCKGTGRVTRIHQMAPGFVQQVTSACDACGGVGKSIDKKFECKDCKGKKVVSDAKTLELDIRKGMKDKQKLVFEGEADEKPNVLPGDIIFVLQEKEDPLFERQGNDLLIKKKINLTEALTGFEFTITHLDKRVLFVKSKKGQVIKPGQRLQIKEEGMPLLSNQFEKGNLIIQFEVEFPDTLPQNLINKLLEILPPKPALKAEDLKGVQQTNLEPVTESSNQNGRDYSRGGEAYDEDQESGPRVGCASQ